MRTPSKIQAIHDIPARRRPRTGDHAMPRVLPLIATAAILAPLAGHSAVLVIDTPRDPLAIAGDDIARIVDGADLASLIASERAVVEMTGGRVLDYALSGAPGSDLRNLLITRQNVLPKPSFPAVEPPF